MAKIKHLEAWGRDRARRLYAPGGSVPFSKWSEKQWGIKDADGALKDQDVGGGTGGHPINDELSRLKRGQEMDDYIPKRKEADI